MRYKAVLIVTIVIVVTFFQGCIFYNPYQEPEYERELNEKDGVAVTIDGVKYVALPELKWHGQNPGETFAEAGGNPLSLCENDPEKNFIFIWDKEFQPLSELHNVLLYRTDREIPPPSVVSVDEMYWSVLDSRGSEALQIDQLIVDKELIKLFFDELKANKDTLVPEAESFDRFEMSLVCFSELVPGARYWVEFKHLEGRLVCGDFIDGYVDFSVEVFEQIIGYEIDFETLTEEK